MSFPAQFVSPSEAAMRLGVSIKTLRLYEQRGLVAPIRTAAGWRVHGPDEMGRAAEVAAMRALGFSLTQVARVLSPPAWPEVRARTEGVIAWRPPRSPDEAAPECSGHVT